MARVLIVYYRSPRERWLTTYVHHLASFAKYSEHECVYLNAARRAVPSRVAHADFDLVIFHYTLLLLRQLPEVWDEIQDRIRFTARLNCPKALVAQDEQVRIDKLNDFVNDFHVSHVFSPSPAHTWSRVYQAVDRSKVTVHQILTGYVDESVARWTEKRSRNLIERPIDIGYRTWYTQPFYGSHGQLKQRIGREFQQHAPEHGLVVDISHNEKDALWGKHWFEFLLKCKYTIGVEGGCSVFDWDGSIASRTREYVAAHEGAPFEEIAQACFPGLDGEFDCHLLSPRHLEAAMTRTCQVLIEGEYGGVLEPGKHYIELKRDFSNLEEVLQTIKEDRLRERLVEQAYEDVVASGRYSYGAFVGQVFSATLPDAQAQAGTAAALSRQIRLARHQAAEAAWGTGAVLRSIVKPVVRPAIRGAMVAVMGEERVRRLLKTIRRR